MRFCESGGHLVQGGVCKSEWIEIVQLSSHHGMIMKVTPFLREIRLLIKASPKQPWRKHFFSHFICQGLEMAALGWQTKFQSCSLDLWRCTIKSPFKTS